MAKKPTRSPKAVPTPGAETERKVRGGSRARVRKDVATEMATGQDQAAALSDQFVGVPEPGEEPVQGSGGGPAAELPVAESAAPEASAPVSSGAESTAESVSMSSGPSDEDIRMRAYHRYLERGSGHGMDFEDWLAAEDDLKARH